MTIIKLKCDRFKVVLGKKNKASKLIPVEVIFMVGDNEIIATKEYVPEEGSLTVGNLIIEFPIKAEMNV